MKRLIVVLSMLGLAACGGHRADSVEATPAVADPKLDPAQLSFLRFGPVAQVPSPDIPNLTATIEFDEQHTARLSALVPGRVTELLVQVGDRVTADQPLIALESPEVRAAQAEYVRAQADLTLAQKGSARADRLLAANAMSEKDYLQAKEDAQKASADFERASAGLERLRVQPGDHTSRYVVRAPFAGTVVERKAMVGMEVGAETGDPLVVVSDLGRVRVVVRLPERELPMVRPGQAIAVHVDAYPQEFAGEVVTVGDVVEDATQTVPVRCSVPNPDHLLKPAMFARVTLKAASGLSLTMVPIEAVLSDGQRFQVIVHRADGQLEVRPVEVGAEAGQQVQILSGVGVGDEVVTQGALFAARALGQS